MGTFLWLSVNEIKADLNQDAASDSLLEFIQICGRAKKCPLLYFCSSPWNHPPKKKKKEIKFLYCAAALNSLKTNQMSPAAFDTKRRLHLTRVLWSKSSRFLESDSVANPVCEHQMTAAGGRGGEGEAVKADWNCIRECLWGFARWLPGKQNNSAVHNTVDRAWSRALQSTRDENLHQINLFHFFFSKGQEVGKAEYELCFYTVLKDKKKKKSLIHTQSCETKENTQEGRHRWDRELANRHQQLENKGVYQVDSSD